METATQEVQESQQESQEVTEVQQEETQEQQTETKQSPDLPEWARRRMGEIAAERRQAMADAETERRRRQEMEAEIARLRAGGETSTTNPNIEQLAEILAEQKLQQFQQQNEFAKKVQTVEENGRKEYGDQFQRAVENLTMAGIQSNEFLEVLTSVPNAEKVLVYLGQPDNVGEAIRLANMNPVQMAIEMSQLSGKAAKALGKQLSKAPPPVQTVDGGASGGDGAEPDPSKDSKGWIAWRNQNARKRR